MATEPLVVGLRDVGVTVILALVSLGLAAASTIGMVAVQGERSEQAFVPLFVDACTGYEALTLPNDQINQALYGILVSKIEGGTADEQALALNVNGRNIKNLACVMRVAAETGDTLALYRSLEMRERLVQIYGGTNPSLYMTLQPDFDLWGEDLRQLFATSPYHGNRLVPYINWLVERGDDGRLLREIDTFLPLLPEMDPVRYWLLARKAGAEGDTTVVLAHLREALRRGLANVTPISSREVLQISSSGKR